MKDYNPEEIETKWQQKWEDEKLHAAKTGDTDRQKFYSLETFPYPSGAGLHVGHPEGYTAEDINARFQRMNGKNVMYTMGWDAFGLPTENYAIKVGRSPKEVAKENTANFTRQLKMFGFSYDWDREINTSDPSYYKWTQWLFVQLYKKGLAYRKHAPVNWCESCKTVLAREQVIEGACERCKNSVIQKPMEQWFFKITDYAEELLDGIDGLDWVDATKEGQRNWIGKSTGAELSFSVILSETQRSGVKSKDPADNEIKVFTTRPDTLFGATYMVLAPEHALVDTWKDSIENWDDVEKYRKQAEEKSELERMHLQKEKTGVELKGITAINPINNEEVPVWIADYVMVSYGTGAIMAVPAHDERDYAFAREFDLPIKQTLVEDIDAYKTTQKTLETLQSIQELAAEHDIRVWIIGGLSCEFHAGFVYRAHNDLDLIVASQEHVDNLAHHLREAGYTDVKEKAFTKVLHTPDGFEVEIGTYARDDAPFTAKDFESEPRVLNGFSAYVASRKCVEHIKREQLDVRQEKKDALDWKYLNGEVMAEGTAVNSDFLDGLQKEEAITKAIDWLEKEGVGKATTQFRLRDWLVSRQRYWGAPIPIIWCEKCGDVPVPEEDLPVLLPDDVDFKPTGEPPLASSKDFQNVDCPKCGGNARRDYETMDTFVDSSWYFLRYCSPHETERPFNKEDVDYWMPTDLYIIGAEHIALHLLYARFFCKAFADLGLVDVREPFQKIRHQGMIMGEDNQKMSKSRGNVVNPDDIIEQYGADTMRMYEMFMGPLADSKPWSTDSMRGVRRFLDKVWKLQKKVSDKGGDYNQVLHQTIKKVTQDIKEMRYNTAISQMMILANALHKVETIAKEDWENILKVLHPFAPHITEELWYAAGNESFIMTESWPAYDEKLAVEEAVELVVQINGKVRERHAITAGASEDDLKKMAMEGEKISQLIEGKEVVKVIVVKGKLVNIVIKQ